MFNSRSLERISDHATNIAEEVIFLVKGIDVRHRYGSDRAMSDNGAEAGDGAALNG